METEIECRPGEAIIEQGAVGHGIYILRSGSVEVLKDNLLLSILSIPGTVFGEMADLLGKERSCSIRAKTHCNLIHISETNVKTMIQQRPEIAIRIMRTLAGRLDKTTQKLAEQFQEPPLWSLDPESKKAS